jgi:hypothetical protein
MGIYFFTGWDCQFSFSSPTISQVPSFSFLLLTLFPSYCKKIRDDSEEWQPMEKYIQARTAAKFTHGICPDCLRKHYGEIPWSKQ